MYQLVVQGKRAFSSVQRTCKVSMADGSVKSLRRSGVALREFQKIVEVIK